MTFQNDDGISSAVVEGQFNDFFRWWSHLHMRLFVCVCLYICGRKNWFRDYDLRSPNLCLGKSITVLLLGIAATNSVTKMKTTEHA